VIFDGTFLSWVLYIWTCTIFFSFIVVCTYLKCYTTNDIHLNMCALCEKKQLKEWMDQEKKNVLFSSMVFLCFFFWVKRIFWYLFWSFDLIDFITSVLDYTNPMLLSHLYFYKYVLNDILFIFQNKGKQSKHSKCTYLWNYLNKTKQKLK
jgi:hypothetical protein